MDVVPDGVADGNNEMDNELFGLGEEIRILRAHLAELEILVKHRHGRKGQISHGELVDLRGRPVDVGAILLFYLLRFGLDFHTFQIVECVFVKPDSREEPDYDEVFFRYFLVHHDCVGDIAEREAALLPVGIGVVWGLRSSFKGSRLCLCDVW